MTKTTLLIPLVVVLLSCDLFIQSEADDPAPPPPTVALVAPPISPDAGDATIEEKIIENNVIVKATMTSFSSEVVVVTDVYHGGTDNRHSPVFRFNLSVSEYLKGTGPSNIVAVWVDGHSYETSGEANEALDISLGRRDSQWDDREAIIFLYSGASGFGTALDAQLQRSDHFILAFGDRYSPDDHYSLHSESNRVWLPTVSVATSTGEYLLDVPPTTKTVTLDALKELIDAVATEVGGGDGSEEYRECVLQKYRYIRNQRNFPEEKGRPYSLWKLNYTVDSGQPAGTTLDQRETYVDVGASIPPIRFEGVDSDLFSTETSTAMEDLDGNGRLGDLEIVQLVRPLPAGEYSSELKEHGARFAVCDFVISNTWTVDVTAPGGTLHEFFLDPVTVGSTVAADSTNGVLEPASFIGADDSSTTVERIAYEPALAGPGQVKVEVTTSSHPYEALGDHILDFIGLDGSVLLSLDVFDATLKTRAMYGAGTPVYTLSWTAASRPWGSGDKLMVRIRKALQPTVVRESEPVQLPMPTPTAAPVSDPVQLPTPTPTVVRESEPVQLPTPTPTATRESGDELTVRVRKDPPSCRGEEVVSNAPTESGLVRDCEVLLRIRDALAGTSTLNWSVDTPIRHWDGVDVDGDPLRVTGLSLRGRGFTGMIPPELGELSNLTRLRLNDNQLTGPIPRELGRLTALEQLNLDDNELTGVIPVELGKLKSLRRLTLRDNSLDGPIPAELGGLSELGLLYLSRNQLSGPIPTELGDVSWLSELTLSNNRLSGSIPAELGRLADLTYLSLSGNRLTGEIPAELGSLSNLDTLGLYDNRLTGPIPASLGDLSHLRSLNLSRNQLNGPLPPELGNLSNLEALDLQDNELSGPIPPELGNLVNLYDLLLFENYLSGPIPAELSGLVNLERMWLSENRLSGTIPPELGSLPSLTKLYLEYNQFTGEIPAFLTELSNLRSLDLGGNQFTGEIPTFLSELSNLHALRLHNNQLTGTIPAELGRLTNLRSLNLYGNQLSGEIPSWLAELSEMEDLSLSANEFTGEIPMSFGSFPNLVDLKLYDNDLTGEIPDSLSNLSKLFRLHLSNNRLSGGIPPWLGSLTAMQSLHLDGNQLRGEIPASLSNLTKLGGLYISENELTGCIPERLQDVENHDLDSLGLPYCT